MGSTKTIEYIGHHITACRKCDHCLPAIINATDDRCAFAHRRLDAHPSFAYPTVEWMRSAGGACGPDAQHFEPINPMPPAQRQRAPSSADEDVARVAA